MAWRIDKLVVRGEIDNREKGKVIGSIWLLGREEPVSLELTGNPNRDLAGHRISFVNRNPQSEGPKSLHSVQRGVVGDMTASRKCRVPDCSPEELHRHFKKKTRFPWHWANILYLEWFSETNGRVVIESENFDLKIEGEPAWEMSQDEEDAQCQRNAEAIVHFVDDLATLITVDSGISHDDEDNPQSGIEAEADAEDARMNLLLDRVDARLRREERDHSEWDVIYEEERERLRIELGEPAPEPLTPEQEAEQAAWIEEMNLAAIEAEDDVDSWEEGDQGHPLVERCIEFAVELHHTLEDRGWLKGDEHPEHPLCELVDGITTAGPKLAGALDMHDEWPPDPLFAGNVLVRLKKARRALEDALRGIEGAEQEKLTSPDWLSTVRTRTMGILGEVRALIEEVRGKLDKPSF